MKLLQCQTEATHRMVVASCLSWSGLDIVLRNNILYAKAFLIVLKNKNIRAYLRNTISLAYHWQSEKSYAFSAKIPGIRKISDLSGMQCLIVLWSLAMSKRTKWNFDEKKAYIDRFFLKRKQAIYDVCIDLREFWQWTKFSQRKWTYFLRHRLKYTVCSSSAGIYRVFMVFAKQSFDAHAVVLRSNEAMSFFLFNKIARMTTTRQKRDSKHT